jgi:hypothetical protein
MSTSQPDGGRGRWNVESLYVHFELWLKRLEKHYDARLSEMKDAMITAMTAVEKLTAAAFAANKEAILKAEEAQRSYNERSNEFRGQLEDQAHRLMPREEALSKFNGIESKFDEFRKYFEEKANDNKNNIAKMRETLMQMMGEKSQRQETRQTVQWGLGQAIAVALVLAGLIVGIVETLLRGKP